MRKASPARAASSRGRVVVEESPAAYRQVRHLLVINLNLRRTFKAGWWACEDKDDEHPESTWAVSQASGSPRLSAKTAGETLPDEG